MTSYTSKPMSFLILICITAALQAQDVFQMPDGLTNLEFVDVGDPGNLPDTNGLVQFLIAIGSASTRSRQRSGWRF